MKEDYQKNFKKLILFFLSNPLSPLMDKIVKHKMDLELVASCSSGYGTSLEKFLYYVLSNQVWLFWVIPKIRSVNLSILFYFHFSFFNLESIKRKGKITKIWISLEGKYFFFGEKIKTWLKIADTSFKFSICLKILSKKKGWKSDYIP